MCSETKDGRKGGRVEERRDFIRKILNYLRKLYSPSKMNQAQQNHS